MINDIAEIIHRKAIYDKRIIKDEWPKWSDLKDHDREYKICIEAAKEVLSLLNDINIQSKITR